MVIVFDKHSPISILIWFGHMPPAHSYNLISVLLSEANSSGPVVVLSGNEDLRNNGSLHPANSTTNLAVIEQQPSPPNPEPPSVEQPPKPKLEGVLVNHNEPRSSSRIGLRVHFNLPEDDKGSEASSEGGVVTTNQTRPDSFPERFNGQAAKIPEPSSPVKEPPPVLAKPKL